MIDASLCLLHLYFIEDQFNKFLLGIRDPPTLPKQGTSTTTHIKNIAINFTHQKAHTIGPLVNLMKGNVLRIIMKKMGDVRTTEEMRAI